MTKKLTEHFTENEIACRCGCGANNICCYTLDYLELFREYIGLPIIVTSACRCKAHNAREGGSVTSWHISTDKIQCYAVDVRVEGLESGELMRMAERFDQAAILGNGFFFTGRGVYPDKGIIHLDNGHAKLTRWIYRNNAYHTVASFPEGL